MLSPKSRWFISLCVIFSLALLGASVASADTCACSDVRPRSGNAFELGPTCAEVQAKGDCDEPYMEKTIAEMKGAPYCQISCGKCPCCQPLDAKLRSLGLSPLSDALAAAEPALGWALKNPATSIALLAPAGFKAGGGSQLDAAAARRHVIPAMNGTGALWTRELLLAGGAGSGAVREVGSAEKGALLVKGTALSSGGSGGKPVTIVEAQSDIEACKSLIHVIDGGL